LLDFLNGLSLKDLASKSELPFTPENFLYILNRILGCMALIYGLPLSQAIANGASQLITLRGTMVCPFIADDMLNILQRRIHNLPRSPLFIKPITTLLEERLAIYFGFARGMFDVERP
jgi:hypothetical protein